MLIDANDIARFKDLSVNIDGKSIAPWIEQTEELEVIPAFTPKVYRAIVEGKVKDPETFHTLIYGGYYDNGCRYCAGLVKAIAYLAYSKYLFFGGTVVTQFGPVVKMNPNLSKPLDEVSQTRQAREAEKVGRAYLQQCVDYLRCTDLPNCCVRKVYKGNIQRFKKIGTKRT